MKRIRMLLWVWMSGLLMAGTALAQPSPGVLSAADAAAVRATVASQLSALASGDAQRAFSFAAPAIRRQFGNAAAFMAMVRAGYPMVIRPVAVTYFVPVADGATASQQVRLQDAEGRQWLATYTLTRQTDGSWRIAGCNVQPQVAGRSA